LLDPLFRPIEKLLYKLGRVDADREMNWREYAFALLGFSAVSMLIDLRSREGAGLGSAGGKLAESAEAARSRAGAGLEYGSLVHHEHQLAVLHARGDHELSNPDELARLSQFHQCCRGHRGIKRTNSTTIGNFWVDVTRSILYVHIFPLIILVLTAVFVLWPGVGLAALNNAGPHGLTEILYAFTSAVGNNGSAFAGLTVTTSWWYNVLLGGHFLMIVPVLALAGNLAQKKSVPPSPGTFPVNTALFTVLLTSVILIMGALTFFPSFEPGSDTRASAASFRAAFLRQ
jgi:K+-transporting ATPase A subunit